jgi:FtsP/CotA-like multicopper oxidase with cupredoxin domain
MLPTTERAGEFNATGPRTPSVVLRDRDRASPRLSMRVAQQCWTLKRQGATDTRCILADMVRSLLLAGAVVALAGTGPNPQAPVSPAPASTQLKAEEVPQPEGWDADLTLPQPADLNPDPRILEFNLEAKVAKIEITPGVITPVWTYNGMLPGPYIRAKVGDTVVVHFRNSLPEATTIHWHGVRVPNSMDGTPGMTQDAIQPGSEFRYEFVVKDAGTYWYHPHFNSSAQAGWGLYGPIVVEDPHDPAAFGDDLVLMLSDISMDGNGQLLPKDNGGAFGDLFGREGNVILVNGRVRPRLKARAGKPQRWRIINAARARYFAIASPRSAFVRIGGDNGLAARSTALDRLLVVPGERLDVVYQSTAAPGTVSTVRWVPVNRGYGSTFNRPSEPMMNIATVDLPRVTPAGIPDRLREIAPIDVANAAETTLDLTIQLDGKVVEMGINGVPSWNAKPLHARLGETQVWRLTNNSVFDHPFHLHGYFFQVLDNQVGEWKDTVNVPVKSTVRIAVKFDERPGMWMFHCHILDHAEVGMMGHLQVE